MMWKTHKVLALAVLCTGAGPALADTPFAVDLLVGQANHTSDVDNGPEFSGDVVSLGVRASYQFSRYAALEMSYQDFGDYDDSFNPAASTVVTEHVGVNAFEVGGKAILPLNDSFSLNARAGAARWKLDLKESVSSQSETYSDDDAGIDLYYGVGAEFLAGDAWRVSLEYTVLKFNADIGFGSIDQTVGNASLALGYQF